MASSVPLLTEFDCIDKNSNHKKYQHLKTMAFYHHFYLIG